MIERYHTWITTISSVFEIENKNIQIFLIFKDESFIN